MSDLQVLDCDPWIYPGGGTVVLVAAPAPGSHFDGWTGCDRWHTSACEIDVPAGSVDRIVRPRALFTDGTPPVVTALPTAARDGALVADWKANESGVTYECSLDGAAPEPCAPPYALRLPEGVHNLHVVGRDANGNAAGFVLRPRFVDTVLDEAPVEGAHTATARFAAHTGGTEIECSLDGGAYARCGGASGPLTLPALADGEHTLRVRSRAGADVDPSPATRTWTVDTRAPETTLPDAPGGPAAAAAAAPKPAFALAFTYRGGRLTRLVATGAPAGTKLVVTVKRPGKRSSTTTIARLVGKRLPRGTKITVRAGAQTKTITLR